MAMDADIALPHYFEIFDSIIYLESQKKFKERWKRRRRPTSSSS